MEIPFLQNEPQFLYSTVNPYNQLYYNALYILLTGRMNKLQKIYNESYDKGKIINKIINDADKKIKDKYPGKITDSFLEDLKNKIKNPNLNPNSKKVDKNSPLSPKDLLNEINKIKKNLKKTQVQKPSEYKDKFKEDILKQKDKLKKSCD